MFIERWAEQASKLGWGTADVFGVNRVRPFVRLDAAGLVRLLDGRPVVALTETEAVSQVPLLGDLPLIGELFKNRSNTTTRAHFYVFVRVNILRQNGFEDLKYLSDRDAFAAGVDDGWPKVQPRVIR